MGVTRKTVVTATCDLCKIDITDTTFVEMGPYGLALHVDCFTTSTGPRLLLLMGEDETVLREKSSEGSLKRESIRLRNPLDLNTDGTVRGAVERVEWY